MLSPSDAYCNPLAFVDAARQQQYILAEAAAARLPACKAMARKEPPDIVRPLRFPYNPPSCCNGRPPARIRPATAQRLEP